MLNVYRPRLTAINRFVSASYCLPRCHENTLPSVTVVIYAVQVHDGPTIAYYITGITYCLCHIGADVIVGRIVQMTLLHIFVLFVRRILTAHSNNLNINAQPRVGSE